MPHPRRIVTIRQWTDRFGRRLAFWGWSQRRNPGGSAGTSRGWQEGTPCYSISTFPRWRRFSTTPRFLRRSGCHKTQSRLGVCRRSLLSGVIDIYFVRP